MNKVIDQRLAEATEYMEKYVASAGMLAQALCDHIKAEKGWATSWHLGDYEAGIDTITIEVDCCCFDEAIQYEMELKKVFGMRGPYINLRTLSRKYDCPTHSRKAEGTLP
jgi:hypothetical protein